MGSGLKLKRLNSEEILNAYCSTCIHKEKCWKPCLTVLKEMVWNSKNESIFNDKIIS